MLDICSTCKNIFTIKDIKLIAEDSLHTRLFDITCATCGSTFKVWIRQLTGPTISDEELQKKMNTPRKDTIHVKPANPTIGQ